MKIYVTLLTQNEEISFKRWETSVPSVSYLSILVESDNTATILYLPLLFQIDKIVFPKERINWSGTKNKKKLKKGENVRI